MRQTACVLVQRQLEKSGLGTKEWAGWFWRLIFRCRLAWASFWSRAAKMAFSLPRSLSWGVMYPMAQIGA
jgi:hypothetical protein